LRDSTFAGSKIGTGFAFQKIPLTTIYTIILISLLFISLKFWDFIFYAPYFRDRLLKVVLIISLVFLPIFILVFTRSKTSFYKVKIENIDFCGARLESTNFNQANCQKTNFRNIQTGIHYKWARWFVIAYLYFLLTLFSICAIYLATVFTYFILNSLNSTQVEQKATFMTCIILTVLGCAHFLTTSLLKNISESILGVFITGFAILLVTFEQPVISGVVWTIAIFAILRIFKILANLNLLMTVFIKLAILFLGLVVFFNYQNIDNLNLVDADIIPISVASIILFILWSTWTATLVFELKSFLSNRVVFYCISSANITLIFLNSGYVLYFAAYAEFEWLTFLIEWLALILATFLGLYLGWQAIQDRENYRLLRDRGVFFCHLFKPFITEFQGANLIAANFSFARLQNANFQTADLTHACWYGATKLETCRFGKSYLRYPSIRKLLAKPTPTGLQRPKSRRARRVIQRYHRLPKSIKKFIRAVIFDPKLKNFDYLDLQGIRLSHWNIPDNLADGLRALPKGLHFHRSSLQFWICFPTNGLAAWLYPLEFWRSSLTYNLANTSFAGSNLCHADLRGANLTNVNLVGSKLHGTDLRDANLTGIYIQDVQLSSKTRLEGAFCEWLYLEKPQTISTEPVSVSLKGKALDNWVFEGLFMGAQDVAEIADIRNNIASIKNEFATIDSIRNRVNREYRLNRFANEAAEKYQIDADLYRQMFEHYKHERRQMERQQYWWQYILWFKIEPGIEKANQWTQELDIFPLLENLGRLSILVAVVTFANNILKPNFNPEQLYRAGENVHPDSERIPGVQRLALEQLRQKQGSLVGIHAEGMNLEGINLRGADLTGANFQNATLTAADFSQATLFDANLAGADLEGAQLGFTLGNEALDEQLFLLPLPEHLKKGANLEKADLEGANLNNANLERAILNNANLRSTKLVGNETNLQNAELQNANLSDADLKDATLAFANLTSANFKNANLKDANLVGANLTDAILINSDLENTNLADADLTDSDLTGANLTDAILTDSKMINDNNGIAGANLTEANLTNADLTDADLTNANLEGAIFCNTTMPDGTVRNDGCPS
jgi:uncharacterized protein YjbI with pentapeptide repeats